MRHKIPQISEINLELKDFHYYFDDEFEEENLGFEVSVTTNLQNPNGILFFVHIRYVYEEVGVEKPFSLFHTDYLSFIEFEENDWEEKESIEINQDFLAHIFGMSFLLIRGSIQTRLSSNILGEFNLPVINPKELLGEKLASKDNNFVVSVEAFDEEE